MYFTEGALFKAQRTEAWYKGVDFRSKFFHYLSHRIPAQSWGNQVKFLSTSSPLLKNGGNDFSFSPPFICFQYSKDAAQEQPGLTQQRPPLPWRRGWSWWGGSFSEATAIPAVPVTRGSQPHPGSQGAWAGRQPYHFTGRPLCGLTVRGSSVHHCQEEDDVQFHGSAGKGNYS